MRTCLHAVAGCLLAVSLAGCVTRTLSVTSEPSGALVWINDVQVGRTPVETDFVYYGTYEVRVVKEGYEPIIAACDTRTPLWDYMGPDLVAEALPADLQSRTAWHFDLTPVPEATQDPSVWEPALIARARGTRLEALMYEGPVPVPAEEPTEAPTSPE